MENTTYLTKAGHKKLLDELEHIKKIRRLEIANRIKDAKELGDLSENAEYADARDEQSFNEGRILELESMLKEVEVIGNGGSDPDEVEIGDTIVVDRDGKETKYTIVGSNEADPMNGKISNESPLGQSFIGKKKNEELTVPTPKGESKCKIVDIKT